VTWIFIDNDYYGEGVENTDTGGHGKDAGLIDRHCKRRKSLLPDFASIPGGFTAPSRHLIPMWYYRTILTAVQFHRGPPDLPGNEFEYSLYFGNRCCLRRICRWLLKKRSGWLVLKPNLSRLDVDSLCASPSGTGEYAQGAEETLLKQNENWSKSIRNWIHSL